MTKEKIMVIEDEADILEVIRHNLARESYDVLTAEDGETAIKKIQTEMPDLILLDLMLPGIDGLEVCQRLKANAETRLIPIIMVTAKGEESDVVLGLGIGADDYITKPFSPKELIARVKAVLRRSRFAEEPVHRNRIKMGELSIDADRHEVRVEGKRISLTLREFRLLHFLAANKGRVYTRDNLLNRIAGDDVHIVDRNIDVHIRSIRKKLGRQRDLIETVRGIGYRFIDPEE